MRKFLLILGWSSIVGSFFDGLLACYALWLAFSFDTISFSVSVDDFLKQHVEFIYWVKQLAFYVMPHALVNWIFNIPALIYFPIRILTSIAIGWWALNKAEELAKRRN